MSAHTLRARATGRWQRLRRRGSEQSGVVLVMVAVLMTAFLGLAAVAIDLGSYYQSERQAQTAADAAALAASHSLPASTINAAAAATTYATTNYPGATLNVTTPYNGNASQVKVTVNAVSPSFLGKYLGRTSANVSASAVAAAGVVGGAKTAIFAKSTTCGNTLYLEQGNMTLVGGVHSNGGIRTSGHGNTYSSGTYGGPNQCTAADDSGGSNSFNGSTSPAADSTNYPWPEDFTDDFPTLPLSKANDPNCDYVGTDLNIPTSQTLVSGTYCYQTIEFNAPNIICTCTFVASSSIQFNQGPDNFKPYYQDLQFYDMDSGNVNLNANGTSFLATSAANAGVLFAPNASLLTVNAPSGTVWGAIESQNVVVNGGGPTTWNGTGTPIGGNSTPPSLVQ